MHKLLSSLCVLALSLSFAACSSSSSDDSFTGEATVGVATDALSAASVSRVVVTVTGDGIDSPIIYPLQKTNGQWQGIIGKIPAGTNRTFAAEAFDSSSIKLYEGQATGVSVTRNETVAIVLVLQQKTPPEPYKNTVPFIDSTTASANAVAPGETVSLSVAGHDVDPGDVLSYSWSSTGGGFDSSTSATPIWTAPNVEGIYGLTVTVKDQKGGTRALSLDIDVKASNGKGSGSVSVGFNTWPDVTAVSANPGRVDVNGTIALTLTALDNDGDALSYSWSDNGCGGTFSSATAQSPIWTAPSTIPAGGTCALAAVVNDGRGGSNTGTITVQVGPPQTANIAPTLSSTLQSTASICAGGDVAFDIAAADPEGQPLTFSWAADGGTLGSPQSTSNASHVQWTAPGAGGTFTVTATVADSSGLTTTNDFQVSVDGNCDADGDGLTADQEAGLGTNPGDPDSDDDGLVDGNEVTRGTNPLHSELLGIAVDPPSASLATAATAPLKAYGYYSFNPTTPVLLDNRAVQWSSGAGKAVVDATGVVTGQQVGVDSVQAAVGVESATIPARVWDPARLAQLQSIAIGPSNMQYPAHGACVQYTAIATFSDSTTEDVTDVATWSLNTPGFSNARLGLGNEGFIAPGLFVSNGHRTQYATVKAALGSLTSSVTVYVGGISEDQNFLGTCDDPRVPGELWALSTTPSTLTLMVGQASSIALYGVYSDGSRRKLRDETGQTWTTDNTAVAEVTSGGWARGNSIGVSNVTVSFGGVQTSVPVTVVLQGALGDPQAIRIEPSAYNPLVGESYPMRALMSYSGQPGKWFDVTGQASWASSNVPVTAIATGTGSAGLVGSAVVSAAVGPFSSSANVRVWEPQRRAQLSKIDLDPAYVLYVGPGNCSQYLARGTYADATTEDLTQAMVWSTSHPSATMNGSGVYKQGTYSSYISVQGRLAPLGVRGLGTTYPGGSASGFVCP